jgi:hypothetical protein
MEARVEIVAYVRREESMMEFAHPLRKVWARIPKALVNLGWSVELVDDVAHRVKVKTQSGLMAWGSVFLIDAVAIHAKSTRVSVAAETPVTAITGLVDFGRTGQRIDLFFQELQRQLS